MEEKNKVILYHTGSKNLSTPTHDFVSTDSRGLMKTFDFGVGFYATPNLDVAQNWYYQKEKSSYNNKNITHTHINKYELKLNNLKIYRFNCDEDWLDFVLYNRTKSREHNLNFDEDDFEFFEFVNSHDILIGSIADDRMYQVLAEFLDGRVDYQETIKCLQSMDLKEQYILKSIKAINNLELLESIECTKEHYEAGKEFINSRKEEQTRFYYLLKHIVAELGRELNKNKTKFNEEKSNNTITKMLVEYINSGYELQVEYRDSNLFYDEYCLVDYLKSKTTTEYLIDEDVLMWSFLILLHSYNEYRITCAEILRLLKEDGIKYLVNMFDIYHSLDNDLVLIKTLYDLGIDFNEIRQGEWREDTFTLVEAKQNESLEESIKLIKSNTWIM